MKNIFAVILIIALLISTDGFAKGGFSSSGRGSFSSSRSSFSSRSYSAPRSSTTTTRTITRSYGGGSSYHYGSGSYYHPYYHPYMMYPGFGMGYGYSNGLVEGLIIGNLMHPAGTTAYSGGGYQGQALLYPDGRVVDQNGYQVGTYENGQFAAVQNGQMIAQPAPAQPQQGASVIAYQPSDPFWVDLLKIFVGFMLLAFILWIIILFIRWLCSSNYDDTEDVSETIITQTTTVENSGDNRPISGTLKRKREKGGQYYVIDPADKTKMYVNDSDDMYEDAKNRIWKLR